MKAKRGDLILIEEKKDYGTGGAEYVLERVTSVTKDGEPRRTIAARFWEGYGESTSELFRVSTSAGRPYRRYRCYYQRHWLLPTEEIDVTAAWRAWCCRAYRTWQARPFTSIDDARAFFATFKRCA